MDRKAVAFARSWATRYVRTKHPHGLDVEDVENRILESLYKYSRGKMNGRDSARPSQDGEATEPQCMMKALSGALNEIQNESRRNLRAAPCSADILHPCLRYAQHTHPAERPRERQSLRPACAEHAVAGGSARCAPRAPPAAA